MRSSPSPEAITFATTFGGSRRLRQRRSPLVEGESINLKDLKRYKIYLKNLLCKAKSDTQLRCVNGSAYWRPWSIDMI